MFINSFRAAQGNLKFTSSDITFLSNTTYADLAAFAGSTASIISCKNITISPPKAEPEMLFLLGTSAFVIGAATPVTGTFQNVVYDDKAWSEGKMSTTLILTGNETDIPDFLRMVTGVGTASGSASYKRHTFGNTVATETRTITGAIVLDLNNGSERMEVLLNNPYMVMGDIKLTGADGHYEVDVDAHCLPQNFVIDVKN